MLTQIWRIVIARIARNEATEANPKKSMDCFLLRSSQFAMTCTDFRLRSARKDVWSEALKERLSIASGVARRIGVRLPH
jgi:hypothetical protein